MLFRCDSSGAIKTNMNNSQTSTRNFIDLTTINYQQYLCGYKNKNKNKNINKKHA